MIHETDARKKLIFYKNAGISTLKLFSVLFIIDIAIMVLYFTLIKALISKVKYKKTIIITDHMYKQIIDTADSIYLLKDGHTKLISDLKDLETYKYLSLGSLD